jgi:hypothetical protein
VADQIDRFSKLLQFLDDPIDILFFSGLESWRNSTGETWQGQRDDICSRKVLCHLRPDTIGVRDAMNEDCGHRSCPFSNPVKPLIKQEWQAMTKCPAT